MNGSHHNNVLGCKIVLERKGVALKFYFLISYIAIIFNVAYKAVIHMEIYAWIECRNNPF